MLTDTDDSESWTVAWEDSHKAPYMHKGKAIYTTGWLTRLIKMATQSKLVRVSVFTMIMRGCKINTINLETSFKLIIV